MKTSSAETPWEESAEHITAQVLAKRIGKEARLREVVEQSASSFFIGGSVISSLIRIVGVIVVGVLCFRIEAVSTLGVWPVFALGAFVEACRANRRLDAMIELERMAKEDRQVNKL
jgi:hypothetical protein